MKIKTGNLHFFLFLFVSQLSAQQIAVSFLAPDTVCTNQAFTFTNTSSGPVNSYYWSVCSGIAAAPTVTSNLANPSGNFNGPAYLDLVQDGLNYYIFVTNNLNGKLSRLDYGTSLNNTPTVTDLGFVISNLEDIHVEKEGANWYGIAVGGMGNNSAILRVNFGTSITNIPTVSNMGNIGGLNYPVTLQIFRSGANIYGLTFSQGGGTVTRFSFGTSFSNVPTGNNLGNIGSLSSPSQMAIINYNGNWHAFICNDAVTATVSRLDFGNSLLNTPTGVNLGNLGGLLDGPRGICLWTECNVIKGFLANKNNNKLFDLSFPMGATGSISIAPALNTSILGFPQTIRRWRIGDYVANYIVNVTNNSISRIDISNCKYLPSSTLQNPAAITFTAPGNYTAYLTCNDAEFNQESYCKSIVVKSGISLSVSPSQTVCFGKSVTLSASGAQNYTWSTGVNTATTSVTPLVSTLYTVSGSSFGGCTAQKMVSVSVSECIGILSLSKPEGFLVYPNPVSSQLNIHCGELTRVMLVNEFGRIIYDELYPSGMHTLNIEREEVGIFLLRAISENGNFSTKLIKE